MRQRQVILASGSPRRKELLEQMGLTFQILPSKKEEKQIGETPAQIVEGLSRQKAQDVAEQISSDQALVIGADTIVVCDGQIMGKPHTEEEACQMIGMLQGKTHQVYTGVTVAETEQSADGTNKIAYDTFSRCTQVKVFPMDETEIKRYVALGESMDKAGAYGIQGGFGTYVEGIEGDYNNVLGLPISALYQRIKNKIYF
ncbi:MAG: Maf family protein [Lachnospiraceae bacterium]|nr:Maf family protein [Lachnospiraceae bacterium]